MYVIENKIEKFGMPCVYHWEIIGNMFSIMRKLWGAIGERLGSNWQNGAF